MKDLCKNSRRNIQHLENQYIVTCIKEREKFIKFDTWQNTTRSTYSEVLLTFSSLKVQIFFTESACVNLEL